MSKIVWKTQKEIEAEKNAPKPPTPEERLELLEKTQADTLYQLMVKGAI